MAKDTLNFIKDYKVMCLGVYKNCNADALRLKRSLLIEELEVVSEYLRLITDGNPYITNRKQDG